MNNNITAKIAMLESSRQCFICGLLGLLPVIGIPYAFAALWIGGRVRVQERQYWNAAKPYRILGVALATFALLSTLLVAVLIAFNSINSGGGGTGGMSGDWGD